MFRPSGNILDIRWTTDVSHALMHGLNTNSPNSGPPLLWNGVNVNREVAEVVSIPVAQVCLKSVSLSLDGVKDRHFLLYGSKC